MQGCEISQGKSQIVPFPFNFVLSVRPSFIHGRPENPTGGQQPKGKMKENLAPQRTTLNSNWKRLVCGASYIIVWL